MVLLDFTEKNGTAVYVNPTQIVAVRQYPNKMTEIITSAHKAELVFSIYVKETSDEVVSKIKACKA